MYYFGSVALKNILGNEYKISAQRGKWVEKKGIMYMATWHPAALLRDETKTRSAFVVPTNSGLVYIYYYSISNVIEQGCKHES